MKKPKRKHAHLAPWARHDREAGARRARIELGSAYDLLQHDVGQLVQLPPPPHIVSSLTSLQNFGGNVGGSFAPIVTGALVTATGDFTVDATGIVRRAD